MVTAQQLLDEGLIPNNAGTSGGEPVQWGAYDVIHFGEIRPEEFRKMSFTPDDFHYIYLQIIFKSRGSWRARSRESRSR